MSLLNSQIIYILHSYEMSNFGNRIDDVVVSVIDASAVSWVRAPVGSNQSLIKLVFVVSPVSTQQ
jgi:hypothetical protein